MIKNVERIAEGNFLFMTAVDMMPALVDIPLKELREDDIFVLQKISSAACHDGICISLGVDFDDKLLTAETITPDLISKSGYSPIKSTCPSIYIANYISPARVVLALQAISESYSLSTPPSYFEYDPNPGTTHFDQWLEVDERTRRKHDSFLKNQGMYHFSIPPRYKKIWTNYDYEHS